MRKQTGTFRIETDSLGDVQVPVEMLYGAQTKRAIDNFQISGKFPHPSYVLAVVWIKYCAALVHRDLGELSIEKASAIMQACREVIEGKWMDQFVVDPFQAGAGTSHHMNVNEVIANRASQILGAGLGEYTIQPNDDVNRAQSTNDVIPTAIRLACLRLWPDLELSIQHLEQSLGKKAQEFAHIPKSGRTHLQDAAPIHLGDEFGAYAASIHRDLERLTLSVRGLRHLGIGGTAVGSGLNAHPEFAKRMAAALSELTGFELHPSENLFESMQSMAVFVDFSANMRTLAVTLTKIANDLRLLASGPTTGLDEILLPPVQPGSSIMPGKVNPVMAEMVNMVMFQVIGCDTTVMMASQAGQLELNVMMPVIAHNLFEMMDLITHSLKVFDEKCIQGIAANPEKIQSWLDQNPILITSLNPIIGYQAGAELVKNAVKAKTPVQVFILEKIRNRRLIDKNTNKPVTEDEFRAVLKTLFG